MKPSPAIGVRENLWLHCNRTQANETTGDNRKQRKRGDKFSLSPRRSFSLDTSSSTLLIRRRLLLEQRLLLADDAFVDHELALVLDVGQLEHDVGHYVFDD